MHTCTCIHTPCHMYICICVLHKSLCVHRIQSCYGFSVPSAWRVLRPVVVRTLYFIDCGVAVYLYSCGDFSLCCFGIYSVYTLILYLWAFFCEKGVCLSNTFFFHSFLYNTVILTVMCCAWRRRYVPSLARVFCSHQK